MENQNFIRLDNIVKEDYLPVFNDLFNTSVDPFFAKIRKNVLHSGKVIGAAEVGLSGGFGFSAENEETPKSAPVMYERFELNPKDMYVNFGISLKAIELGAERGMMLNALDNEIRAAHKTASWNTGRSVYGNGTGKLATVAATATESTTVTLDSVRNVKEGLLVDFYTGTTKNTALPARVVSVNRSSKVITLDKAVSCAEGDIVTVQNSRGRELTGLGAIFDDGVSTLYGIKKAEQPIIVPSVIDANDDIGDAVLTDALRHADRDHNSEVDMLIAGDKAYDNYLDYLRSNNIRVEESSHVVAGGFKAIKFIHGNREVDIVNSEFVPETEIWGVPTKAFEFQQTGWKFAPVPGASSHFQLLERQSAVRALLVNYGDLICSNPGGCIRIINCGIA